MGTLGGKGLNKFVNFNFLYPIPVHKCNAVMAWFRDHQELTVVEWPSRSSDLNPIENLCGIMVNEWTDRNERTPDVLERHYMEVWESIRRDPELCQQQRWAKSSYVDDFKIKINSPK